MKTILSLAILCVPFIAQASSKISYLNVDGNNVHFALAGDKAHTIPSCAVAETNQHYGVSLLTEAGRAMYSLLITAMSTKQAVTVVSANDCSDVDGVERAQSVNLIPDIKKDKSSVVSWAGYVGAVKGSFTIFTSKGAHLLASEKCARSYAGSRVMTWEDYVKIINQFPHSETVWLFDAVQSLAINKVGNYGVSETLVFKSGKVLRHTDTNGGIKYSDLNSQTQCADWKSTRSNDYGTVLTTGGFISLQSCTSSLHLACVK
ncbi:hypothetical protein [Thalassotalea ganghwensis]